MTAQVGGASPLSTALATRAQLRHELRRTRRAIPINEQRRAALSVAQQLERHWLLKPGTRIGVYLAMRHELSLAPFIKLAWLRHTQVFVPHIDHARRRRMSFHPFTVATRLRTHCWGMAQLRDVSRACIPSTMLDVVLVPLLGFDVAGNRLGMGAGFYDRHFARLGYTRRWRRPRLIGIAYACQQVPSLPTQPHDVPMDAVVTQHGWMRVSLEKTAQNHFHSFRTV